MYVKKKTKITSPKKKLFLNLFEISLELSKKEIHGTE